MPKKDKDDAEPPELSHQLAAEIHERAAKLHRAAAEHHINGDHEAAVRHAAEAYGHAASANDASNQARKKSQVVK
jgi:hypothetical protein